MLGETLALPDELETYLGARWWTVEEVEAGPDRFYPGRLPVYLRRFLDDTGVLSAWVRYNLRDNISHTIYAHNLNDPVLKYYGANRDQPRAFYANGRQYYFSVRVKF